MNTVIRVFNRHTDTSLFAMKNMNVSNMFSYLVFSSSFVMFFENIKSQTKSLKVLCSHFDTCKKTRINCLSSIKPISSAIAILCSLRVFGISPYHECHPSQREENKSISYTSHPDLCGTQGQTYTSGSLWSIGTNKLLTFISVIDEPSQFFPGLTHLCHLGCLCFVLHVDLSVWFQLTAFLR